MARIAFILLCHKDPAGIIAQAQRLTATGDFVSIHFDRGASAADDRMIRDALAGNPRVTFARRRIRCGWGQWSLVAATLEAVRAALTAFPQASHLYLLSGDCMPVKSSEYAREFLDAVDCDYIETFDFLESGWIKTGIREERLIYRHYFNERRQKALFYSSMRMQQRLGLTRKVPDDLQMMIGSQWWCLRRETVEKLLVFCDRRRDVMRFFATTWIPDETFFQTLVAHLVPRDQIATRTLTFLMFTDYGMPVTFYNDHYDLLLGQDYLFARKISPEAAVLKERLGVLWQSDRTEFAISAEGPRLHGFLTGQGRVGRRFAPRAWQDGANIGRGKVLHVVVAKKWHIGKRLVRAFGEQAAIRSVNYLFNEEDAGLPDMGGVEHGQVKRHRHHRAFLRLLIDRLGGQRLLMCLDPASIDILADLTADKAETRVLFVDTELDDDYVRGHLGRVGLAGENSPASVIEHLTATVRRDLEREVEALRDMSLPHFGTISLAAPDTANAAAISRFLDIPETMAHDLLATPDLMRD